MTMTQNERMAFRHACTDAIKQFEQRVSTNKDAAAAVHEIQNALVTFQDDPVTGPADDCLLSAIESLRKIRDVGPAVTGVEAIIAKRDTVPLDVQRGIDYAEDARLLLQPTPKQI